MLQDGSINPDDMVSFNHYALGEVASFLHRLQHAIRMMEHVVLGQDV
jgi:alpha-L-rhamnosidase